MFSVSTNKYVSLILNLLPEGDVWNKEVGSNFYKLAESLAEEMMRLDNRCTDLINEANPLSVNEMLIARETEAGLPDSCIGALTTVQDRRQAVVQKWTARGGATKQYLIDIAAVFGFNISINEFRPFRAGINTAGQPLYDQSITHTFEVVSSSATPTTYFKAGESSAGELLWVNWSNLALECLMTKLKPAHTTVLFTYT